jgi:hypothetical protein
MEALEVSSALQNTERLAILVEISRDNNIGIQNNPHYLAGMVKGAFRRRSLRAFVISASICLMVSLLRPLRLASAPIALSHVGVGANVLM